MICSRKVSLTKYPQAATAIIPVANVVWNKIPQTERFEGPTNSIPISIIIIYYVYIPKYIFGKHILNTNPEI